MFLVGRGGREGRALDETRWVALVVVSVLGKRSIEKKRFLSGTFFFQWISSLQRDNFATHFEFSMAAAQVTSKMKDGAFEETGICFYLL